MEKLPAGRAIKNRRKSIGFSQEELAFRADVSPSLITKIERSSHDLMQMKAENLFSLISALEWTPEEFTEATGVQLPTIKTTIEPTTRSTHHIKTYSLTISYNRGELVQNDMQTVIPEAWSGEYEAIHIPPNRILIFLKTEVVAEGQKVVLEQGGIYIGRLANLKNKLFFIELDDAYPDKTIVLESPKILGVVKEERITY